MRMRLSSGRKPWPNFICRAGVATMMAIVGGG
jgi:hypothetical protein